MQHREHYKVLRMCRILGVSKSGYYDWLNRPVSNWERENQRLLKLIRDSYEASGRTYGSPRVFFDLREAGEVCSRNRVARLMRVHKIRAQRSYKTRRYTYSKPAITIPNRLKQEFNVDSPDNVWVTDITYIRTYEGWLYLAIVMDLYSRKIVGWSMKPTLAKEVVLDAILMAVWRRSPQHEVIIHSDQGSQYGSDDWNRFCASHDLVPSMSRRGNCYDNAAAESFFSSLKKEKIRRYIFKTRGEAKTEIFDYIEVFYNRARRHKHLGQVSPEAFEKAQANNS